MNPTTQQLKAWRARENLTLAQAADVCGIKNFSRHVSGPNPQPLPAPCWFNACAYSSLHHDVWRHIDVRRRLDFPETACQSMAIRTLAAILETLGYESVSAIREEMKK